MINFDGKEVQEEFNEAFGNLRFFDVPENQTDRVFTIDKLSAKQLWWLVKFSKHVRGRCRSNAAFNNYMNRNFPSARFETVTKEFGEKQYEGLVITPNITNKEVEGNWSY